MITIRSLFFQRRAYAAFDLSQSYEATQHLCTFLDTAPNEQALLFLPVFYANLDESRIPNSEQLDRILQTCGCHEIIIRPMLSIETLIKLPGIPVIAYRELWPRVWSWLHFLQTYHEVLGAANETDIGVKLLALINRFISDATAAEMIYSTPGVRVLLARTWSLLLRRKEMPNAWLRDISLALGTFDPKYSYHLEELVDGAGGKLADLASLVVIHIAGVMGPGRTPPESAIYAFGGVITFIMRLIRAREEDLWPDLLAQGLATVLPTAICGLHDAHRDDMAQELLDKVLLVMLSLLRNCTDPRWCAETLEAGFLRALVLTATPVRTHKHIEVKHFFHTELPKALVYRCVVSTLDLALRAAHADSIAPSFTTSPAFNDWSNFVALAEQRLEVLKDVESQECARMMGCGNMECCAIGKKADFRRCSACRKPAYCSEECQAQDWAMGHRGECARTREANLADPDPLSRRDRSFMRALLHNDYKRLRYDIYMHQLAWLHE
ncbi:hypothetical protein B0H11DRAFT_1980772 [Mycena galericulata]|nr:hypothetical protein B0H11DRAFT_1980772 [Mycena galericulata]